MALDSRLVDMIHTRMLVRYGARWIGLYSGVDPDLVKADWAEVLHGATWEHVAHALENLPDGAPPNAAQFRALCFSLPPKPYKQLPAPPANPERVRAVKQKLQELRNKLVGGRQ